MASDDAFTTTHIERCANSACPNQPHEGRFTVIETNGPVVGGHRPLRLVMCSPCASALTAIVTPETVTA